MGQEIRDVVPPDLSTSSLLSRPSTWLRIGAGGVLIAAAVALLQYDPCDDPRYPPRESSPYALPWPSGGRRVHQGQCALRNTHDAAHNASFAIDFAMPVGSPVVAARAGAVLSVEERWADDDHQVDHGNRVLIDHGDGTYAIYGHLGRGGSDVEVGQRITQGQAIARSGSSGLVSAPHLHFMILSCPLEIAGLRLFCTSQPTSFRDGPAGALAAGDWVAGGP